ncbi:MAG: putative toxin-antitoxin system toxin component, PIN family [Gemmatimonadaceae bacterium]
MRVVLDTNVVVSAVFFGGTPGRVLAAWSAGRFVLILSPAILEEYRRVGHELGLRHPDVNAAFEPVLALIAMNAIIVDAPALVAPVSADPDDDKFLAAAAAAQAPVIVSGDRDLLEVSGWRGIEVLSPRQFLDQHLGA